MSILSTIGKVDVRTPVGISYDVCGKLCAQTHLLIAGTTGSGKSTLINDLIYHLLYYPFGCLDGDIQLVLIDPKRVELVRYADLPHTLAYASEKDDILGYLRAMVNLMDERYKSMQRERRRVYQGSDIYIIIDEYADICDNKDIVDCIVRIAQLGRASKIHIWLATQRPTRSVITGRIKTNLDCRVALRCVCAQDSRNIIERNGAELIKQYNNNGLKTGIMITPYDDDPVKFEIPYLKDDELDMRVTWWTDQVPMKYRRR